MILENYRQQIPWATSTEEALYCIRKNISEQPICPVCHGKPVKFSKTHFKYNTCCSRSCAARFFSNTVTVYENPTDNDVISELVQPDGKSVNKPKFKIEYLKKCNLYDYLKNRFSDIDIEGPKNKKTEIVWRIYHKIYERPLCPVCGKPAKFIDWESGYGGCSYRCQDILNDCTNLISDKESARNLLMNEDGSFNKNKGKSTYAGPRGLDQKLREWWPDYSRKDALWCLWNRQDSLPVCPQCGNAIHPQNTLISLENLHKFCSKKCDDRYSRRLTIKRTDPSLDLIFHDDGTDDIIVRNLCTKHGDVRIGPDIQQTMFINRLRPSMYNSMIVCPICNPINIGSTSIEIIIEEILDSLSVRYEKNNRHIDGIRPKELDFWLPDYRIGIECNGCYWHSGKRMSKLDADKRESCEKAGIRLLTFWEDDIKDHSDRIKSYLKSVLGLNMNRIGARLCEIRKVPAPESRKFLDRYHLQGNVNASVRLGLYYKGQLLEIMTFGRHRRNLGSRNSGNTEWELYRLCTKDNWTVQGGASKLLSYFKRTYSDWTEIISYCHREISDGTVYGKLGFSCKGITQQGFSYIKKPDYHRINRFSLRKSEIDDGSGRTADEILESLGYAKCWDAGNTVWEIRRT